MKCLLSTSSSFICLDWFLLPNFVQVNNVGTNIRKPTIEYKFEEFTHVMSTNFESAYHNAQLAHPLLKASRNGNVIFVSSVAGVVAISSGTPYAASKGILP